MIIKDQINLMGINPLIGPNIDEYGDRFVDMSCAYSKDLIKLLKKSSSIKLRQGVYVGLTGPNYETPAECRFIKKIGGDVVGMSTVWETIAANHCKIKTVGISCIANYGSGINKQKLNHQEVIKVANKVESNLLSLIKKFIRAI